MNNKIEIKSLQNLPDSVQELIDLLDLSKPKHEINCIAFYGEMGAGKTTIIKEICKLLNVSDLTSSPSFSLINEYHSANGQIIYHFDFYRINKKDEAYDLGYEEYFYSNKLCLIEWPEKIESLLPYPHIRIDIEQNEKDQRILQITKVA
jgi:tRNA threonylcarbamoyladenosine biosynthesis protein TsaE